MWVIVYGFTLFVTDHFFFSLRAFCMLVAGLEKVFSCGSHHCVVGSPTISNNQVWRKKKNKKYLVESYNLIYQSIFVILLVPRSEGKTKQNIYHTSMELKCIFLSTSNIISFTISPLLISNMKKNKKNKWENEKPAQRYPLTHTSSPFIYKTQKACHLFL